MNSKVKNKTAILQILGYFPSFSLEMTFFRDLYLLTSIEVHEERFINLAIKDGQYHYSNSHYDTNHLKCRTDPLQINIQ
jgi:hypothetical protein